MWKDHGIRIGSGIADERDERDGTRMGVGKLELLELDGSPRPNKKLLGGSHGCFFSSGLGGFLSLIRSWTSGKVFFSGAFANVFLGHFCFCT